MMPHFGEVLAVLPVAGSGAAQICAKVCAGQKWIILRAAKFVAWDIVAIFAEE